jgi:hypothetical protein
MAFIPYEDRSPGSESAIKAAKRLGKKVIIIT